ncbi:PAS domain-containing protein [Roseobacter sp. EG26]|uniref:PAS domain-containing protein n=1 Tax=Roseobacter sp. EG26 TaxID=3412477 RepID=UPI003CE59A70
MRYESIASEVLPRSIVEVCNAIPTPISIADPDEHDLPLFYVNAAFEKMTKWDALEIVGRNARFLQGPETDVTVASDLGMSLKGREGDVCCLLNYRHDGSPFLNLLAIRPIRIHGQREFLMGCHFAYSSSEGWRARANSAASIDHAFRQVRYGVALGPRQVSELDILRLDMILMRFEAAFTKVQNKLVERACHQLRQKNTLL